MEPPKRRREGLEVTSRRGSSGKTHDNEEDTKSNLVVTKKAGSNTTSGKVLKIGPTSSSREQPGRTSNPKREMSHEKEEMWAI